MGELHRRDHVRFLDLRGVAFDHHGQVAGPDVDQVQVAVDHFRVGRVGHELAVDAAHADGAERPQKRNVGNRQRGARGVDRQDVGFVLAVGTEHRVIDLDFVVVPVREQRPDGAVRDAGRQDFLLGRPAFAFEISARDPAGGVRFFAVLHLQREVIDALAGLGRGNGCGQYHGSPRRMVTAPLACLARSPDSNVIFLPPTVASMDLLPCIFLSLFLSFRSGSVMGGPALKAKRRDQKFTIPDSEDFDRKSPL